MIQQTKQWRKKSFCTKFSSYKENFFLRFSFQFPHSGFTFWKKNSNKKTMMKENSRKVRQKRNLGFLCCIERFFPPKQQRRINRDLLKLQLGLWNFSFFSSLISVSNRNDSLRTTDKSNNSRSATSDLFMCLSLSETKRSVWKGEGLVWIVHLKVIVCATSFIYSWASIGDR